MPPIKKRQGKGVVELEGKYYNVAERAILTDTVLIKADIEEFRKTPGWYSSFSAFAAATNHSFFNVRNLGNCDEAYCNIQARDQLPFAFQADSIGVSFFAPSFAWYALSTNPLSDKRHTLSNAIWSAVIPQHSSITVRLQQDDKLDINSAMAVPGYGPTGGGYGQNYAGTGPLANFDSPNLAATQGVPDKEAPFKFSTVMNCPRDANLSVRLSLSEYARQLLTVLPGPQAFPIYGRDGLDTRMVDVTFGVTVHLAGKRLVQQRGRLHR